MGGVSRYAVALGAAIARAYPFWIIGARWGANNCELPVRSCIDQQPSMGSRCLTPGTAIGGFPNSLMAACPVWLTYPEDGRTQPEQTTLAAIDTRLWQPSASTTRPRLVTDRHPWHNRCKPPEVPASCRSAFLIRGDCQSEKTIFLVKRGKITPTMECRV